MQICATGCGNAKLDLSVPSAVTGGSTLRFIILGSFLNANHADRADTSGLEDHFTVLGLAF